MPPKKKKVAPARSPAAGKQAENAAKNAESSKNVKLADGKDKPGERKAVEPSSAAGKRGRPAKVKGERQDEVAPPEEAKRPRRGGKQVNEDAVEDEGSLASQLTASNRSTRTVIIEACTQCKSFKERADKVKRGLESAIPGISVEINPQKPRRGYFEIRQEITEVLLSLPSMNRPFTSMKQLKMDEVVEDLIKQCK